MLTYSGKWVGEQLDKKIPANQGGGLTRRDNLSETRGFWDRCHTRPTNQVWIYMCVRGWCVGLAVLRSDEIKTTWRAAESNINASDKLSHNA